MEFFYKDMSIQNHVIEYQWIFKHQYLPCGWVKFSQLDYNEIHVVENGSTIFYGHLVESFKDYEESVTIGLFVAKTFYHHCWNKNHEEIYKTYHTWGGYFQDKNFIAKPIKWSRQQQWHPITHRDFKIKSIGKEPLNIKVINNINGDFFYEIHKAIDLITPNTYTTNHLVDFLYKNLKEDIIVDNYSLHPSLEGDTIHWTGSVDFIQNIPIKIKESWQAHDSHHNLIVLMDNTTITTDDPVVLSSIDGHYINKIMETAGHYQNFSWIIHITTEQRLWVGQPVSINIEGVNYYGFVIKIIWENYNNGWLIKGVIKAYDQWSDGNNKYEVPKSFTLNLNPLKESWDQWHWVYDGGLTIQWPTFKNLYQNVNHNIAMDHHDC